MTLHTHVDSLSLTGCRAACLAGLALLLSTLGGCTVLAVADVAASAVVGTAGLVVDAAVGTARVGGKVIGKTADLVLSGDELPAE